MEKRHGAVVQVAPADPAPTLSQTGVMMGLAVPVIPVDTGRLLIMVSGYIGSVGVGSTNGGIYICTGDGNAPANGDAPAGVRRGEKFTIPNGFSGGLFAMQGVVTGLELDEAIWIDLDVFASNGVTSPGQAVKNLSVVVIEY